MDWFVRGEQLLTRSRVSGATAERGFEYQRSFALFKMVEMLTGEGGLVSMRYECAQDVDLMFGNGQQIHVQIKDFRKTPLSWARMKEVLAGFVRDEFDASKNNDPAATMVSLRYQLTGVGLITDEKTFQILRNSFVANNAEEIVDKVIKPKRAERQAYLRAAHSVLGKVTVDLAPRDNPEHAYRLMTEALLIRFGVLPDRITGAVGYLDEMLVRRQTIYPHSVAEWVSAFVPENHPASDQSALRLAPISFTASDAGTEKFYSSQSEIWAAISSGLDVPREAYLELVTWLTSEATQKIVVTGPSGSGKSTLARRALWDLQQKGRIFALELTGTENVDEALHHASSIGQSQKPSGRPVVILVDDLFNYRSAVEFAKSIRSKDNIKILGTAWSVDRPEVFGDGFRSVALTAISGQEAEGAASALKTPLSILKPTELARIQSEGQFLVLNLALLGQGSNVAFGRKILMGLKTIAKDRIDGYIDLCAAGTSDTSIPRSILRARGAQFDLLDIDKDFEGLVFPAGNGEQIRSGHRLIALAVIAAAGVEPVSRLLDLSKGADFSIDRDRRFALRVVERAIEPETRRFAVAYTRDIEAICRRAAELGHYVDCLRASKAALELDLREASDYARGLATADRVFTARDAAAFRSDSEKAGRADEAFPTLLRFYDRVDDAWGRRIFVNSTQRMTRDRQIAVVIQSLKWAKTNPNQSAEIAAILNSMAWIRPGPPNLSDMIIEIMRSASPSGPVAQASCKLIISNLGNRAAADVVVKFGMPLLTLQAERPFGLAGPVVRAANNASERVKAELFDRIVNIYRSHPEGKENAAFLFELCAHIVPRDRLNTLAEIIDTEALDAEEISAATRILQSKALSAVQA